MIKRSRKHYLMQYLFLPLILVVSDIIIGMMGHYSGTVGIWNVFSIENFIDYITTYTTEFLLFLIVALSIALYIEYYISELEISSGKIKRSQSHYIMQYVGLPAILIGSDLLIGMIGHYSGTVGMWNVFSIENFIDYISNHYIDLGLLIVIAFGIALYVEYYIDKLEKTI